MNELFSVYEKLLLEWNEKINLTAITDPKEIRIKHFEDSLSLFETGLLDGEKKVLDLGSGAGFPGIPVKIKNPSLDITLMDSLGKRIKFLEAVIEKLSLKKITAVHGRAEELGRNEIYRESFDVVVSRAVAELPTLLEYAVPFVKAGGYFIAMKGANAEEEIKKAENALKVLGCSVEDTISVKLPPDITHCLIVIRKNKKTEKKYPRGQGKPRKNPL